MAVKTHKEAEEHKNASAPLTSDKKQEVKKEPGKIKLYLPQITHKGDYHCVFTYNGKEEKVTLKDGILEVSSKEDLKKFATLGFRKLADKKSDFGVYYCDEYSNKSFNLVLDDYTTILVDNGKAFPSTKYQVDQLIKRYFKLYKPSNK